MGDRLGRYELTRVLGDGGFATVWRARSVGPGGFERAVAIKVMPPARARQKRFQNMLFDEARLAARIEHPSVAQIWEVGEDPRSIYVVMELVDGAALDVLRDRAEAEGKTLAIGAVFRVLADVCAGLHAAHELRSEAGEQLGLVHRDVSPQNILVSRHGNAKVIDFGIAKAKERLGGDTKSGFIKGKVSFMAPEQARAEDVDRRADVWAVGAVAYDIFAGHPPVDAASDIERLAHLAGPAPIPPLDDAIPEPLRAVVARALEKDATARFPTALAMKQAIEEALIESEHETGSDDVARLLAPYFPSRGTSESAAAIQTPVTPPSPANVAPAAAQPARASDRGASSTLDARAAEGSIEIPVNTPRLWPIAAAAALAAGIAWFAFLSPSASSRQPSSASTPAAPDATSGQPAGQTSPASPRSPQEGPSAPPSPAVLPSRPASVDPGTVPASRPAPARPKPAEPAAKASAPPRPAASPPSPPPAAPPPPPPARSDEDAIE